MAQAYIRARRETGAAVGNQAAASSSFATKTYYYPARSFQPTLGPEHLTRDDEIRGNSLPVSAITNLYNPSWALSTRLYPDAAGFSLTATLGAPTTTNGNGVITDPDSVAVPTGAYRHVWTAPFGNGVSSVNPPTLDLDAGYVDQSTYFKARGAAVDQLEITSPDDDSSQLSLSGSAAYLDNQSDPSLTASLEALTVKPFSRANLTLPTWLSGTGSHENITLNISRNIESVRTMGTATGGWPDTTEYTNDPVPTLVTCALEQRQLDDSDIEALLSATGFTAVVRWTTGTHYITASYPYKLYVAFSNAQYTEGDPEEMGNKRRHGASYTVRGSSSDGSTASETVTLVNGTSSYS